MLKLTTTLGIIRGRPVTLVDPSEDVNPHIQFIRTLTDNGGHIESEKKKTKVDHAIVLHSVNGVIKERKFK